MVEREQRNGRKNKFFRAEIFSAGGELKACGIIAKDSTGPCFLLEGYLSGLLYRFNIQNGGSINYQKLTRRTFGWAYRGGLAALSISQRGARQFFKRERQQIYGDLERVVGEAVDVTLGGQVKVLENELGVWRRVKLCSGDRVTVLVGGERRLLQVETSKD